MKQENERGPRGSAPGGSLDCIVQFMHRPLGDRGEDAFAYDAGKEDLHAIAVFDGCGGAGSWQYPDFCDATGAYVAAQTMAETFSDWFGELSVPDCNDPAALAESIGKAAYKALSGLKASSSPMGVSGSLVKSFPCTASAALIQGRPDSISVTAMNIGDSRVYVLSRSKGLIQLTTDDSKGGPDALASLRKSVPLSAMMNGDKEFSVRPVRTAVKVPCAVICATDGVFGYLRSPMDFEYLLLKSIMEASSFADFEEKMKEAVSAVTGDDSTMLAAFYGWGSFDFLKNEMADRYKYLRGLVLAMDQAPADAREQVIDELWQQYKPLTVYSEMKA